MLYISLPFCSVTEYKDYRTLSLFSKFSYSMREVNAKPTNNPRQFKGAQSPCVNHDFMNEVGSRGLLKESE